MTDSSDFNRDFWAFAGPQSKNCHANYSTVRNNPGYIPIKFHKSSVDSGKNRQGPKTWRN